MEPIIITCPAKVNLTLRVVGKRADGYHELDSIMAPVTLADRLTVTASDDASVAFTCDDETLTGDDNLVVKAAHAIRQATGVAKGARSHLEKRIPVAAGLGGGSSDAAGALKGLLRLWDVTMSDADLLRIATSLGADVPFFLDGRIARAEGVGERLTRLAKAPVYHLLLVKPDFGISALEAYKKGSFSFAPDADQAGTVGDILSGDPMRLARRMVNDLAPAMMRAYPQLARLQEEIATSDPQPITVMMSGSGPTLMALYATADRRREAEERLQGKASFVKGVTTT